MLVHISVVIPVYGSVDSLGELHERLEKALRLLTDNFEIIFVDDGGPDGSWAQLCSLAELHDNTVAVSLSRNFGQHAAITCGLGLAKGDWIVVMDCDLQDRPEEIPALYNRACETGVDIVFAQRKVRKDNCFVILSSRLFYSFLSYITGTEQDSTIANFGIYKRKVVAAILSMREYVRYFPVMVRWVGFSSTKIIVTHAPRAAGKSSYTISKLVALAVDVLLSFSNRPLLLVVKLGLLISFLSLCFGSVVVWRWWSGDIEVTGWSSIIVSIWFLAGLIIFILGNIGLYIGKIFDQVKGRPVYIVSSIRRRGANDVDK